MALNMHQKEQKFSVGQQRIVLQHLPAAFCKLLDQHPAPKEIIPGFLCSCTPDMWCWVSAGGQKFPSEDAQALST